MKETKVKIKKIIFRAVTSLVLGAAFMSAVSSVTAAEKLDISAYISNVKNEVIPNGEYEIRFSIYSTDRKDAGASDAAGRIWEETQKIYIQDGILKAYLGDSRALPENLSFSGGEFFLGIKIGSDSEMVPRKRIGSVPLAVNSEYLNGAKAGTSEGDLLQLGSGGKVGNEYLNVGDKSDTVAAGDDERFHLQNSDKGTNSLSFNLGNKSSVGSNNFDISVSNAVNKPSLRFNGTSGKWEFSNDGSAFSSIASSSSGTFLKISGGTMEGAIDFFSTQTFGGATLAELGYLSGLTGSVQSQIDSKATAVHSHSASEISSGIFTIARGGTGISSYTAGDMLYYNSGSGLSRLAAGANGQVLIMSSGVPTWTSSAPGTPHQLLSTEHSDTTPAAATRGALITGQGASATWSSLALGASGYFLKSNGTDTVWAQPAKSDVGLGSVENTALSTWNGSANINTLGTITSGIWNGTAIASGNLASNVMLEGENISLLTNDSNFITDGNTNWDNSYGFITASSTETLTNKTWNGNVIGALYGGTGLSAYGTANQIMGMNAAGTALEYKTINGTANQVNVTNAANSITLSLPQSIAATSSPTFAGLSLSGNLALLEGGVSPIYQTIFQGGDQSANITYTLPVALGSSGQVLKTDASGNLYWATVTGGSGGIGTVTSVASGNGLTGGPITETGTLSIDLLSSATTSATTSSYSGLEFVSGQLTLLHGCSDNEVLSWNSTGQTWRCASVSGVGGVVGSGTNGYVAYWTGPSSLSSEQYLSHERGGLEADVSAANGLVKISGGTTSFVADNSSNWNTAYTHSQLTSGNPHSVTKSDVGLGSVENTALSTWNGSANINTLGTITSGTWNAAAISATRGGTGISTYASGDIIYASAINTLSKLAKGTDGQVLVLSGGFPIWSSSAPGAAHNFLSTEHSDTTPASATRGALITGQGISATWSSLALGTSGYFLKSNGTDAVWTQPTKSDVGLGSVENTALSTWNGSANINTLGTIASGIWNGTAISSANLASNVMLEGENISLLTNDSNFITDGNTNWDNSYGFITASSTETLTNKTWNGTAISATRGGTGLSAYGTANQIMGMNAAGTALEYKTINGTADQVNVTNAANSITLSLPQSIATTSSPTFAGLSLSGNLALLEGGVSPIYQTIFQGGDQSANITYTLPVALGSSGQVLKTDASGNLYWATVTGGSGGIGTVTSVASGNGLTGGPITETGTLSIDLLSSATTSATTSSYSGLEFVSGQLTLLHGCSDNEVLSWNSTGQTWRCASVSGVGGVVGSGTNGYVAYWTGTSSLSSEQYLSHERGGLEADVSVANGLVKISGGATSFITDNSTNWNSAYTHSQLASGNPHSVTKSDVGLGSVENTALSTWSGSSNLTTLGTIASGTWNGTAISATRGGTGISTYASGDIIYASAINTLSKLAKGTDGQVLVLSGGFPIWSSSAPGAAHNFLSTEHSDTTPAAVTRGALITGQGISATWSSLALGTSGYFLKSNGTDAVWTQPTKSDVGLGSVENTALSTWNGSANINTLGTITSGIWNGTAITSGNLASNVMLEGENISLLTNDSNFITDGNTNWDNSYGFITASSTETLTNKTWNGNVIGALYGGTGLSAYGTANQIMGMNAAGTALEYKTINGTADQVNVTNAANSVTLSLPQSIATTSSPTFAGMTLSSLTQGSLMFAGAGGAISQDNINLFWDNTNKRLGLGTASPSTIAELYSSTANPVLTITAANDSAYNPMVQFGTGATPATRFSMGVDASDGNKFKVYPGASITGTGVFSINQSGTTSIASLEMGAQNFAADSGSITWIDMPVTAAASNGTIERYTARLDGNAMLTIYGKSDGVGGVTNTGIGIGNTDPSAYLHIKAGTATAGTAPLKLTAGTNLTAPEAGAIEYDGTNLFYTDGISARRTVANLNQAQTMTNKTMGAGSVWNGTSIGAAYGGTGLSAYGTANQIMGMNAAGTALEYKTINGTANQVNVTNAANSITLSLPQSIATSSSPTFAGMTLSGLTQGSLMFAGAGGAISQDNVNLFWDNTNKRLGLGTATPTYALDINGASGVSDLFRISANGTSIMTVTEAQSTFNNPVSFASVGDVSIANNLNFTNGTASYINFQSPGYIRTQSGWQNLDLTLSAANSGNVIVDDNLITTGNLGIGQTSPSAYLHIKAGTATAGTAPLKLTAGTNLTAPEAGAIEYDGTNLFYTDGISARRTVANLNQAQTMTNKTMGAGSVWNGTSIGAAYGGTGLSAYGTANQIMGMNAAGTALEYKTVNGTANQVNVTNAANSITLSLPQSIAATSSPTFAGMTLSGLTQGSLMFAGAGGAISQDNANLFWDNTNKRLGIGTINPTELLEVVKAQNAATVAAVINLTNGTNSEAGLALRSATGELALYSTPSNFTGGGAYAHLASRGGVAAASTLGGLDLRTDNASGDIRFYAGGLAAANERMRITSNGNLGIGQVAPSAYLHIKAGTATAETAPLKLTAGTNLTAPEAGAIEYDGTNLFYTDGTSARRTVANLNQAQTLTNKTMGAGSVWNGTSIGAAYGGTGLSAYGTANQIMGMNAAGTALEYKTISGTADQVNVTNAANSITLSLPQSIATSSSPTFTGLSLTGNLNLNDDQLIVLGNDGDTKITSRATSIGANTAVSGLIVGTPVVGAIGANSTIISNITANADIVFITNQGGNSKELMRLNGTNATVEFGAGTDALVVDANGKIGIGNVSVPTALLHIGGTAGTVSFEINSNETTGTNNVIAVRSDVASADDMIFRVQANGAVFADGAFTGTGADYAEYFNTKDTDLNPGDAVCIDIVNKNSVTKCSRAADDNVIGIVSTNPSVIGNASPEDINDSQNSPISPNTPIPKSRVIVGLIGQVPAKISVSDGEVRVGDSLTPAKTKGLLKKALPGESTVGIALESAKSEGAEVKVLISRRNKSMTVEAVEQKVIENIAAMELQDEMKLFLAQQMTTYDKQLADLASQVIGFGSKMTSFEGMLSAMQSQMDLIKLQNQALTDFIAAINPESLIYRDIFGNLNLGNGILEAKGVVAGEFVVKNSDQEKKTAGNAIIKTVKIDENKDGFDDETLSSGKEMMVKTTAVTETSKIFTSYENNPGSQSWVEKVKDDITGEFIGFKILVEKMVPQDTNVSWWIIEMQEAEVR